MIRTQNLSKCYWLYERPLGRLWDWLTPGERRRGKPFWALRDVTLEAGRGESLGIVGVNGAGKSTLLKLISGTTVPTSGTCSAAGRVSALLELGTGFHPEFSGRENIAMNGKLAGLLPGELEAKTPDIIAFSELAAFIDQPLRTYSSGMVMRLAFAIASSVDPDVLIIDEALAVGDLHFQQKCLKRIREFHDRGVTVLFVSHDPALIKNFCSEAVLLDAGRLIDRGRPDAVLDHYNALLAEKYRDDGASSARIIRPQAAPPEIAAPAGAPRSSAPSDAANESPAAESGAAPETRASAGHRAGNFAAAVSRVWIESLGTSGNASILTPGAEAAIVVRVAAAARVADPTVGIMIKDRLGNELYGINTYLRGLPLGALEPGEAAEVRFSAPIDLGPGLYSITAAIHGGPTHTEVCYDWQEHAHAFQVLPSPADPFTGVARLRVEIDHTKSAATPEELAALRDLRGQ